jgi:hypothetical protein
MVLDPSDRRCDKVTPVRFFNFLRCANGTTMPAPPAMPLPSVHSTSQSKGSGSHHFASYPTEDPKHQHTIELDQFLSGILHLPSDWEQSFGPKISQITSGSKFEKLMKVYDPATVKQETDLYDPFVRLANHCLEALSAGSIKFCQNDLTRKPDLVIVEEDVFKRGERNSANNLSEEGLESGAFHWRELLFFWEFKLGDSGNVVPGTRLTIWHLAPTDAMLIK